MRRSMARREDGYDDDNEDRPRRRRRPAPEEDDYDDEAPRRRERREQETEDNDELPRPRRKKKRRPAYHNGGSGPFDSMFANTSPVVLVLFAILCGGIALILALLELVTGSSGEGKRNALITLATSFVWAILVTIVV